MRAYILILILVVIVIILIISCNEESNPSEPEAIPTYGLIAYYPFNGNANDASGNDNNGTVFGATLAIDRFGNLDKAYNFNGGTNRVQIDIANLPVGNSSRTISLWANGIHTSSDSFWSEGILIYGGGSAIKGDAFSIFYNHDPLLTGLGKGLCYDVDLYYISSNEFFNGQWKHLVVVYNQQTSKMTFYIDNRKIDEQIQTINTIGPNYHFNIGIEQGKAGLKRPFYGKIDDVRIYNRVLSDLEIQQLFHEGGWK
jgi:hypothetical protein